MVDFHTHLAPAAWRATRPLPPALTDLEGFLERKQAEGIDVAVLINAMVNLPGAEVDNLALDQVKAWNEWAREVVTQSDGRVAASVGINPFGGPAMLAEMRAAVQSRDFRGGVTVNSSVAGRHLGAPELEDFWALAGELGVPVFVHPPADPPGSQSIASLPLLEYGLRPSDVALSIASAILSGALERHPTVSLIAGAGGGGVSMLVSRLDIPYHYGSAGPPQASAGAALQRPPSAYLDQVYVDSCSFNAEALSFNIGTLGVEHVVFGTDSPPLGVPAAFSLELVEGLPISAAGRQLVLGGNAARLMKL